MHTHTHIHILPSTHHNVNGSPSAVSSIHTHTQSSIYVCISTWHFYCSPQIWSHTFKFNSKFYAFTNKFIIQFDIASKWFLVTSIQYHHESHHHINSCPQTFYTVNVSSITVEYVRPWHLKKPISIFGICMKMVIRFTLIEQCLNSTFIVIYHLILIILLLIFYFTDNNNFIVFRYSTCLYGTASIVCVFE